MNLGDKMSLFLKIASETRSKAVIETERILQEHLIEVIKDIDHIPEITLTEDGNIVTIYLEKDMKIEGSSANLQKWALDNARILLNRLAPGKYNPKVIIGLPGKQEESKISIATKAITEEQKTFYPELNIISVIDYPGYEHRGDYGLVWFNVKEIIETESGRSNIDLIADNINTRLKEYACSVHSIKAYVGKEKTPRKTYPGFISKSASSLIL